jgi:hypothetical protein
VNSLHLEEHEDDSEESDDDDLSDDSGTDSDDETEDVHTDDETEDVHSDDETEHVHKEDIPEADVDDVTDDLFRVHARIVMAAVCSPRSDKSFAWRDVMKTKPSDEWADDLIPYIPSKVKIVFGKAHLPTLQDLKGLAFSSGAAGTYMDILTPEDQSSDLPGVYPGMTNKRQRERKKQHDHSNAVLDRPESKYYQMKHNTLASSQFGSLVVIPIDRTLPHDEQNRRRLLSRIGELFFTLWLCAIDWDHKRAKAIYELSKTIHFQMYGSFNIPWTGFATHSPLQETLGVSKTPLQQALGMKKQPTTQVARYAELMQAYADHFGGLDKIPELFLRRAEVRKRRDHSHKLELDARRRDRRKTPEYQARKNHLEKLRRARFTDEQKLANLNWHRQYDANKIAAMTASEKEKYRNNRRLNERIRKVKKKLADGEISQQEYDWAEAHGWYSGKSTANHDGEGSVRSEMMMRRRKVATIEKLHKGKITQAQFDDAKANKWYLRKTIG